MTRVVGSRCQGDYQSVGRLGLVLGSSRVWRVCAFPRPVACLTATSTLRVAFQLSSGPAPWSRCVLELVKLAFLYELFRRRDFLVKRLASLGRC